MGSSHDHFETGKAFNQDPGAHRLWAHQGDAIDQAAFFVEKDVEAAKKAVSSLGLTFLEVTTEAIRKACDTLQEGVVSAQGRFSLSPISKAKLVELQQLLPQSAASPLARDPWANLKPGDTVLAAAFDVEEAIEGWYPAVIVKKDDEEFVVRWRDFPNEPNASRSQEYLSLMHPRLL